jgi:hypothetical protein
MRKSLVAALLVFGAIASSANLVLAAYYDDAGSEGLKLVNGQMAQELRSRASRLGTSTGNTDTLWVGYTPGHETDNYWSIWAGFGKDGYYRPINGLAHKGVWDWEQPIHADSLQGWWPLIQLYASTGGITVPDYNRPWWALDFGNMANYRINQANGRTFGVIGVWHRDGGSLAPGPVVPCNGSSDLICAGGTINLPDPAWTPPSNQNAAWMGLRAHGDNTYRDAITNNPFSEDVLEYTLFTAASAGGNDQDSRAMVRTWTRCSIGISISRVSRPPS